MQVFSHQFPITQEKAARPIEWRKPGKLVPGNILQNPLNVKNLGNWYLWGLFFIRLRSYGILHRMENAWVFSSNFHSIRNVSETHQESSGKLAPILIP